MHLQGMPNNKKKNPHVAEKKSKKRKWFSQVNWKARNVVMFDLPSGTWCCQSPLQLPSCHPLWLTCRSTSSQARSQRGLWANGKRGVCVTRRATFANWMKIFGFSARRQRTHRHTHTHAYTQTCDPRCIRLKIDMFWGACDPFELPSNCETVAICSACATHSSLEA